MSPKINKPYRRTVRQFSDGHYSEGGRWQYVQHDKYAQSPEQYVRAFLLILKDLKDIFDYVEPADNNLNCYSFRIHELLLRSCIEVEANCKAILTENGYKKPKKANLNMNDYEKINYTHRLSSYRVKVPVWNGQKNIRAPFSSWESSISLQWYKAYNITKHDRHKSFEQATFENLIDSVCGLLILISAQFLDEDFSPGSRGLAIGYSYYRDGMEPAIGEYFRIEFPNDWPEELKYDFDWKTLNSEQDPFQEFDYSKI